MLETVVGTADRLQRSRASGRKNVEHSVS